MKTTRSTKSNPAAQFVRRSARITKLWAEVIKHEPGSPEWKRAWAKWSKAA